MLYDCYCYAATLAVPTSAPSMLAVANFAKPPSVSVGSTTAIAASIAPELLLPSPRVSGATRAAYPTPAAMQCNHHNCNPIFLLSPHLSLRASAAPSANRGSTLKSDSDAASPSSPRVHRDGPAIQRPPATAPPSIGPPPSAPFDSHSRAGVLFGTAHPGLSHPSACPSSLGHTSSDCELPPISTLEPSGSAPATTQNDPLLSPSCPPPSVLPPLLPPVRLPLVLPAALFASFRSSQPLSSSAATTTLNLDRLWHPTTPINSVILGPECFRHSHHFCPIKHLQLGPLPRSASPQLQLSAVQYE